MKQPIGKLAVILMCVLLCCVFLPAYGENYTVSLPATQGIYHGPGVAYGYAKSVGQDGVYTIVEEAICEEGFLWGRLKSGAGWVQLTDAPIEVPEQVLEQPYTLKLSAWVPVYSYPSEMYGTFSGIVGEDGVYTVVDEAIDELGNTWAQLLSGMGWVNLNYIRMAGEPPVTAYFADVFELTDELQFEVVVENGEYMVKIAFRANEKLNYVRFTTLSYEEQNYKEEKSHCWIRQLEKGDYFIADVVFHGDMTAYGISFTDETGNERYYSLYLSGMNGLPVLNEYIL